VKPIHILSTKFFSEEWLNRLRAVSPQLVVTQHTTDNADDVPLEVWAQVEVLYAYKALPSLEVAPHLRWVQLDTAGYDHVLASPLSKTDIVFTNLAGVAPPNMAEYALLMMMAFGHRLPLLMRHQREANWPTHHYRFTQFTPSELLGATVGVIGYGAIGREIGRIAHAFGMRVLAVAPSRQSLLPKPLTYQVPQLVDLPGKTPDEFYTPDQLLEMLPLCDYVVLVVPHTASTHHLMNEVAFRAMKKTAALINIARGGVVDEVALIRALREGWIAGAALDVFEQEPLPADSPLWTMDNVILTPHVAGFTSRYFDCIFDLFSTNLRRYMAGEPLLNQVLPSRIEVTNG
jgi:phosphoglycerate dehydrogenase-like enzyme